MVTYKQEVKNNKRALLVHSSVHFILTCLCVIPFCMNVHRGIDLLICLLVPFTHGVIDWLKSYFETHVENRWGGPTQWINAILEGTTVRRLIHEKPSTSSRMRKLFLFSIDQVLHIAVILFSIRLADYPAFLSVCSNCTRIDAGQAVMFGPIESVLIMVIIGLCATVVSGIIVQMVTEPVPIAQKYIVDEKVIVTQTTSDDVEEIKRTTETTYESGLGQPVPRGRLIGYLERVIIVLVVCMGAYSAIGFIVAAKSLARLKKLDNQEWAEYFLVGTLCSLLCGTVSGFALKLLVHSKNLLW